MEWIRYYLLYKLYSNFYNDDIRIKLNELKKDLLSTNDKGGKTMIFGNGGSAAMASHVSVDLTKKSLPDKSLNTFTPLVCANCLIVLPTKVVPPRIPAPKPIVFATLGFTSANDFPFGGFLAIKQSYKYYNLRVEIIYTIYKQFQLIK